MRFLNDEIQKQYEDGNLTLYLQTLIDAKLLNLYFASNPNNDRATVFAFNKEHAEKILNNVFGWRKLNLRIAEDKDFIIYGENFNETKIINHNGEFNGLENLIK